MTARLCADSRYAGGTAAPAPRPRNQIKKEELCIYVVHVDTIPTRETLQKPVSIVLVQRDPGIYAAAHNPDGAVALAAAAAFARR